MAHTSHVSLSQWLVSCFRRGPGAGAENGIVGSVAPVAPLASAESKPGMRLSCVRFDVGRGAQNIPIHQGKTSGAAEFKGAENQVRRLRLEISSHDERRC
jgi:hypothetical protein